MDMNWLDRLFGKRSAGSFRRGCECIVLEPSEMIVVDYMEENEEYFQRQASHRQSRRRFRKINQKGERQTIIDTVDPYPVGKPPLPRGYHTCIVSQLLKSLQKGSQPLVAFLISFSLRFTWGDNPFIRCWKEKSSGHRAISNPSFYPSYRHVTILSSHDAVEHCEMCLGQTSIPSGFYLKELTENVN
ncbi:hypothetical protein DV515_00002681 [Chloebia gouldiae]|uniref:Uncharacterized protein n=1 Tax=Chloebia gouldiae TaxID=44316 RepID=A0A3L8SV07_CHLGU|nr:hypothetical protein DV515_00002681 [Chloebia gouldiae]